MSISKYWLFLLIIMFSTQIYAAEQGYNIDNARLSGVQSGLLGTAAERVSMLIPALFIIISVVAFMIDFGTVGVLIGSMVGLGVTILLGLVTLSGFSIIALLIMAGLLAYRVAN